MGTLLFKRLLLVIPNLIGVIIVTFLLTRALPGDPAAYFAGPAADKQAVEQIRVNLGLDKPLIVQFGRYISDLSHGDLGNSLSTGQPVVTEIRNRLPASAELTLFGLVLSIVTAVPLGILGAVKQGTWIDHTCRIAAGVLYWVVAGLCVLLPAWLVALAAWPTRRFYDSAFADHRLLPDR